jgi:hypothetical protein
VVGGCHEEDLLGLTPYQETGDVWAGLAETSHPCTLGSTCKGCRGEEAGRDWVWRGPGGVRTVQGEVVLIGQEPDDLADGGAREELFWGHPVPGVAWPVVVDDEPRPDPVDVAFHEDRHKALRKSAGCAVRLVGGV